MSLKVYYLDDEVDLAETFLDLFETPNIRITTFSEVDAAIQHINADPPDLFFVDYRLPRTTGDEIAKLLDPNIPKILVTGDLARKTEYKFTAVFHKPFDTAGIESFLEEACEKQKAIKTKTV